MPKYKHMPNHPYANERGIVEVNDKFYEGLYLMGAMGEDKRMMRGNEPVVINYISDNMPPTKHMALDIYDAPIDSKSKFRRITKERGCVEVGDQTHVLTKKRAPAKLDRKLRRDHIKDALQKLRSNQVPRDGNGRLKTEIL